MKTINYDPKSFSDIFDTELGKKIWEYLNSEEAWVLLKLTTDLGHPAAEGIGDRLLEKFKLPPPDTKERDRIKQAIGHMIRPIMEANGYELVQKGAKCRMKLELFSYASRYAKSNN
jgi:hypothetical protein